MEKIEEERTVELKTSPAVSSILMRAQYLLSVVLVIYR